MTKNTTKGITSHIFILGKLIQTTEIKTNNHTQFTLGNLIDIKSISKGKGFCGVIKRHGFKSNRQSHGNSKAHNKPGSIGMCQDPGRVFPQKQMAGRMGNTTNLIRNLRVIKTTPNSIIIKGCIPGSKNTPIKLKNATTKQKS